MTKAKRKSPPKKRKSPARKKIKKASIIDRAIAAVPWQEKQVQNGLTVGLIGVFLLGAYATGHYSGINQSIADTVAQSAADAGFEVQRIEVTGVQRINELTVYDVALSQKDRSMVRVDIDEVREELLVNGWIKDARISRRLPDTLVIDIVEREPIAIWDRDGSKFLIDDSGATLEELSDANLPELPIVRGNKVNRKAADLHRLLDEAPALKPQIAGAEWIGNRRWNLEFKSGETLALPEGRDTATVALVKFAQMDGINRLLGRGVAHFDLRDDERAYLRMRKSEQSETPES